MNASGEGFGVAPIPMYREYDEAKDQVNGEQKYYRTASHNIAKAAGISVATTKFKQCSAWLDYQSTHSTDILNDYYETKLQYGIAGNNNNNVKVLEMLRNNVSTALDKCYDDAITNHFDASEKRWCTMINHANYQPDNIRVDYKQAIELKANYLQEIQAKYEKLPG